MNADKELLVRLLRDSAAVFLVDPDAVLSKSGAYHVRIAKACVYWYLTTLAGWPLKRVSNALPYSLTFTNVSKGAIDFRDQSEYSDRTERLKQRAIIAFESTWNEISDSRLLEEKKSRKGHRFTRS